MLLMNKVTAIKRVMNGSDCSLIVSPQIWGKYVKYWDRITPRDNIVEMVLEILQEMTETFIHRNCVLLLLFEGIVILLY